MRYFFPLLFLLLWLPGSAAAIETMPQGNCSTDPQFTIDNTWLTPGQGLISTVVDDIQDTVDTASWTMYEAIANSDTFFDVVPVALTLYIIIYAIVFTFGMVQFTMFDFFVRLIKLGIIVGLLSLSSNWYSVVYDNLNYFFSGGTDAIINFSTAVAAGIPDVPNTDHPFTVMDAAVAKIISAKMIVTLLAMVITGPYGLIFALLLVLSLGSFMKALLSAMWVYLMALILRALMIAMAPIFLVFMLFERTRHLFTGWLSQLINTCMQPILLFVFFAFFATLLSYAVDGFLATPVCKTFTPELWRGGPTNIFLWRFMVPGDGGGWVPYPGLWGFNGPENAPGKPFPIDLLHILIFYFLAELAGRFNAVVLMIASDLSGAATNLSSMQSPLSDWFSPLSKGPSPLDSRRGPGGRSYAGPAAENARSGAPTDPRSMMASVAQKGPLEAARDGLRNLGIWR